MSWASKRETTRTEDTAYCLMGIFNVKMPLLYGEGERAFTRLQEEIMRSRYDHSLFTWNIQFPNTLFGTSFDLDDDPTLGVGIFAPHPVSFISSADITPHGMKRMEPYAMTNRGLQIHLRIIKCDENKFAHTPFAILQCGYKNRIGTAIGIPLIQMSRLGMSESQDDFCRITSHAFIEVKHSEAALLVNQKIYLHGLHEREPQLVSMVRGHFHRCWLREYGRELGVRFHKALYCQSPTSSFGIKVTSHAWNYENMSMAWKMDWRGARAALYFSKDDGPAFVVVLTFRRPSNKGGRVGLDIHIEPLQDDRAGEISLDLILVESEPLELGRALGEAKTTFPFENLVMTAQVKKEVVFDDDMFVLDLIFSDIK